MGARREGWITRLMYRLSGGEAAAGLALLLFTWRVGQAVLAWAAAALTYGLAAHSERLDAE